jgi:kynurenine 3-monooxygenase
MIGTRGESVTVAGAGLAGALLALVLARRGARVTVYERRADPRTGAAAGGRSINLALAARGLRGLSHAAVLDRVRPLLVPMRGRAVHEPDGTTRFLPYGQRPDEINYSVSRSGLGLALIEAAAGEGVRFEFDTAVEGLDLGGDALLVRERDAASAHAVPLAPTIGADGAGSAVRGALARAAHLTVREELLDHDYVELTIPAREGVALAREALHIWPCGGFMLIALPNPDGTFTATLFLPREGPVSFAAIRSGEGVRRFFEREFPHAIALLPALETEFAVHPQGRLGTVYVEPWHAGGHVLLLGDAAHAIVPFHGQGMNCAFEDVTELDALLDAHETWAGAFAAFSATRKPNADAIAAMALENYEEMRDDVLDPVFLRRKAIGEALERLCPDRFIPRYSMVMFHAGIPYAEARRRGAVQAGIVADLDAASAGGPIDEELARALVRARLTPVRA